MFTVLNIKMRQMGFTMADDKVNERSKPPVNLPKQYWVADLMALNRSRVRWDCDEAHVHSP